MHVGESFVLEPSRCLLASNPTGAVHHYVLVFFALQHVLHEFDLLPEGVHIRCNSPFEVAHFAFVVVAHIDEDGVLLGGEFVERLGIEMHTGFSDIKCFVVESVRNDFIAHLDGQFEKRLAFIDGVIQPNAIEEGNAVQVGLEGIELGGRNRDLGIDAFFSHVRAAFHIHLIPVGKQVVAEEGGVGDARVLIERNRRAIFFIVLHSLQ